jgi:hypothetical protein
MTALKLTAVGAMVLTVLVTPVGGQPPTEATVQSFQAREGYEQARYGEQVVKIKTARGEKALGVSFAKLRVAQTQKPADIRLPGAGLALIQHEAGSAKFATGHESFSPLEGEWLRLVLPAQFSVATDQDVITLDLIVISEEPP